MPCDVLKLHENKQTESPNEPNQKLQLEFMALPLCLAVCFPALRFNVPCGFNSTWIAEHWLFRSISPHPAPPHSTPQKEEKKMPRFVYLPVLIVFLLLVIEPLNKFAPVSGNQQLNKLSVPVGFLPDQRLHFWFFMTASALDSKNVSAPICLFEDKKKTFTKKRNPGSVMVPSKPTQLKSFQSAPGLLAFLHSLAVIFALFGGFIGMILEVKLACRLYRSCFSLAWHKDLESCTQ